MASQTKLTGDAEALARCVEADAVRDRADEFEAATTRHLIRLLGGSSIWERAAAAGVLELR